MSTIETISHPTAAAASLKLKLQPSPKKLETRSREHRKKHCHNKDSISNSMMIATAATISNASILSKPPKIMKGSAASRRRARVGAEHIQEALDIATDTVERSNLCRNNSNERAFFGEKAFPLPDIRDMDRAKKTSTLKPKKSKSQTAAPNFFDSANNDFEVISPDPAFSHPSPTKKQTKKKASRDSSRSRKPSKAHKDEDKDRSSSGRSSSRSSKRSRSRGRAPSSSRRLSSTEHSSSNTAMNNTSHSTRSAGSPSVSTSEKRGRRSSGQAARCSSARREMRSRSRSKSRDRSKSEKERPLRRKTKTPSTTKPPRAGSETLPPRSPKADARKARRTKSIDMINVIFKDEASNTTRTSNMKKEAEDSAPPPP
ncbi:MAG: hypothetical protein SGARI_001572, partial [Bacillariaceae sp.]